MRRRQVKRQEKTCHGRQQRPRTCHPPPARSGPQPAVIQMRDGDVFVTLVSGEYGVSPGQACVFYADDNIRLRGESRLDNHYGLYLNDMGW